MGFQVGFPALRNAPPSGGGGGGYDTDAQDWITRVETADAASLEVPTKDAMNQLVLDLKASRTWRGNTITLWDKLFYTLPACGPRTLDGALVPIENTTASTVSNSGNMTYTRKTGITVDTDVGGNPTVDIPVENSTFAPQNDRSFGFLVVQTGPTNVSGMWMEVGSVGGATNRMLWEKNSTSNRERIRVLSNTGIQNSIQGTTGWRGATRISSTGFDYRIAGTDYSQTATSNAPTTGTVVAFNNHNGSSYIGNASEAACFHLGLDTDLAALEVVFDAYRTALNSAF